ncbi:MAG: iron-sulfur cluster assembly scaffold protein [Cohaesibacteraceae bacterium]|nr:iron-sulfur cluster assembly scaffold protein [Cohaesibacteraceae bacterium]MBL4875929.1 iron-sulfur cluster assembly scaffold protein [Cohaesibacteraceae bacterium]
MLDSVYNAKILEFAGNIPAQGSLENPDAVVKKHSKLCGSTVEVSMKLVDGKVAAYAHEVNACALGQAAASIMARSVIGATIDELRDARDAVLAMLTAGADAPSGRFSDAMYLAPVKDYPARHLSTLLAFEAALEAAQIISREIKAD